MSFKCGSGSATMHLAKWKKCSAENEILLFICVICVKIWLFLNFLVIKTLDMDPHWNQCGSKTLTQNSWKYYMDSKDAEFDADFISVEKVAKTFAWKKVRSRELVHTVSVPNQRMKRGLNPKTRFSKNFCSKDSKLASNSAFLIFITEFLKKSLLILALFVDFETKRAANSSKN